MPISMCQRARKLVLPDTPSQGHSLQHRSAEPSFSWSGEPEVERSGAQEHPTAFAEVLSNGIMVVPTVV